MGTYSLTPTVAESLVGALATALGASPLIKFYSGSVPANAAASLGSAVLLGTVTGAATPIASYSDTGTAGRGTWGAIASGTVGATGTASFFRSTTSGGTVIDQGGVGTSSADCVMNTTAFTAGSTLTITSRTNDQPYGP